MITLLNIELICDCRELYPSFDNSVHYNDHYAMNEIYDIKNAINMLGFNCNFFGGVKELSCAYHSKTKFENELFLNMSDGMTERYSRVQVPVLCDMLNLRYSGCGPFETALASNKFYSKLAIEKIGIQTTNGFTLTPESILDNRIFSKLKYPVIIKPNHAGSSLGITKDSVCENILSAKTQARYMLGLFDEIIIEEYISGYDVTNFILGNGNNIELNEVLLAKHHNKFFFEREAVSYLDYANNKSSHVMANQFLSESLINEIKKISKNLVIGLNINDIARIDYRVTKEGKIYFLEVNTIPAISMHSQVGTICRGIGIEFKKFLEIFIHVVCKRLGINYL